MFFQHRQGHIHEVKSIWMGGRVVLSFPLLPISPLPHSFLSPLPLNCDGGGVVFLRKRAEAASAKQLSDALGRHLPAAGQLQEAAIFFPSSSSPLI